MKPAPPLHERSTVPSSSGFRRFAKSGRLTPILVGLLCVGLLVASYLRGSGSFHRIGESVNKVVNPLDEDEQATATGPGGQDPIRLTRSATSIGKDVEFLSATLLPGRGMNVFQITAMVPGHGEVPLLFAPPVETTASQLTGKGEDAHGEASMAMGGAFLLPWAGRLSGTPSADGATLQAQWQDELLHFPALSAVSNRSVDGLFLARQSTSVRSDVLPDGQYAQGVFTKAFQGEWPSTMSVTVTVELSAHTLDLTMQATNTGQTPTPVGMGWHPMFAIPSGDRANAGLKVPSNTVLSVNHTTGLPTGRTETAAGDFGRGNGAKLGSQDVDATYTALQPGEMGSQPAAELRDPAYNLLLRLTPMSPNIANLHVEAPADKKWVSIGPNTNVPDAFGPEWRSQDTGMEMLAPGATVQWKVRLEVAPVVTGEDRTH
jgi:aldose 1-epimerase